jgi:hypothetical protein
MWGCVFLFLALFVLLIISLVTYLFDPEVRRGRAFKNALRSRDPVSDEEFLACWFPDARMPAEVPTTVRRVFGKYFGLAPKQLHPDDDFIIIVGELDISDLFVLLERECGVLFEKKELESTWPLTIRAFSDLVCRIRVRRDGPSNDWQTRGATSAPPSAIKAWSDVFLEPPQI